MSTLREGTTALQGRIQGRVLLPEDEDYDVVRRIWNAMIDRRPAVIVQCGHAADVPHAIQFARAQKLDISVRGCGHNIAGNAVCQDGLMIDLSGMRGVRVDPGTRRAWVDPGASLNDFDKAVQQHGLATPMGINSTTGVSGLTLGGGFGWLTRKYGMTVDNLLSADVVTAGGETLHTSENENPDLFWALRGGGGNFGVVTQFEFGLHPVGPEILAGLIVFPLEQARDVLRHYQAFVESASEDLSVWAVLRKAPPLPFLPPEVHGRDIIALAVFHAGDLAAGEKAIAPLRRFGEPYGEHVGPQPYVQWQTAFDPLLGFGARNYWKSHNFRELSDGAIDIMIDFAHKLPSPQCEVFLGLVAGAANRVPVEATAYPYRDAKFVMNVHGRWEQAADDAACIGWARAFFEASTPYASAGVYVNFMTEDEGNRVTAAYGPNYERLVQIKRKYDPENVFHLNQNIRP